MTDQANPIRPKESYASLVGKWTYRVERIDEGIVFYTVLQTKQKCQASMDDFMGRVKLVTLANVR